MNDNISRVMAIARLTKLEVTNELATMTDAKRVIAEMPAADVATVVHGRWVWREDDFEFECSACKCGFDYNKTYELFDHGFQFANYCPNCGAKMDGGVDNATD